jgi:hemoglobin
MDMSSYEDCLQLTKTFYHKLAKSELLSPIFYERLGDKDWTPHLEIIASFWETVLFQATTYKRQSFQPHASMNLEAEHFAEWFILFTESVDELFTGSKAEEAKQKAKTMAILFQSKIEYNRNNGGISLF